MEEMQHLIEEWGKAKAELEAKQQELLENLNRTSKNSSSPPSADPLNAEKKVAKKKSGRKVGGQPGHKIERATQTSACRNTTNSTHHHRTSVT